MVKLAVYLASLAVGANLSPSAPAVRTPAVAVTAPRSVAPPDRVADAEQKLVDLANAERARRRLRTLTVNPLLTRVARDHSREMWEKDYFDHYSPTPGIKTPMNRYLKALGRAPRWAYLGENLFYCSIVDADRGHRSLMSSRNHRDNIVNARFREIGVGVFVSSKGQFHVTQLFLAQTD